MKLQFLVQIGGKDSIDVKFDNAMKDNPNFHVDLMRSFAHAVMMVFRFDQTDEISVENFRVFKIPDEIYQKSEENKKTESKEDTKNGDDQSL